MEENALESASARETILLASHNKAKAREMEKLLAPLGYRVITADRLGLNMEEAKETATTFAGNSMIKARYAYGLIRGAYPVLADDSGICFHGLDDFPGVNSARWAPDGHTDYAYKTRKILDLLKDNPDHSCAFHCVLTLIDERGAHQFAGVCEGEAVEPRYTGEGFGYDPIFLAPTLGKTFGEATLEEKDAISHRGRACQALINYLESIR